MSRNHGATERRSASGQCAAVRPASVVRRDCSQHCRHTRTAHRTYSVEVRWLVEVQV
jgi:hypothetical protein